MRGWGLKNLYLVLTFGMFDVEGVLVFWMSNIAFQHYSILDKNALFFLEGNKMSLITKQRVQQREFRYKPDNIAKQYTSQIELNKQPLGGG